jgi:hypothetical protein
MHNLKAGLLYHPGRVSSTSSGSGATEKAVNPSNRASGSKRATKKTSKAASTDDIQSGIDEQQRLAMVIKCLFRFCSPLAHYCYSLALYSVLRLKKLWNYLFQNVNRAVDELYFLCESESNIPHCEAAIKCLDSCRS